ncbi:MAG TPA: TolC family protein, partial [Salinivirgaceae bacterium]|nr:TolC family protein [Salinivirgaceae bacterium]
MRNIIFLFFVICAINTEAQDNTKTLSLPTCINYAIEHNLSLKKQELSRQVLQNNYKQSKYELLPDLNAMSRFGKSFGQTFSYEQSQFINQQVTSFNVGLSSNVYLFEGFRKMHTTNRRLLELETGKISYEILKNQLILEIVNAYLITLYNQEQLEILVEQLSTTDQQIERTQKLIESGTVAKGDLLALTSQRAEEESQLVGYDNQIKISLLNLSQLMNYTDTVFEIEKPDIVNYILTFSDSLSVENLYSEALAFLPEIKLAEVQLDISKKDEKIAKSGYYPTLALSAAFSSPYNNLAINPQDGSTDYMLLDQLRDRRQAEFGVSLSIPIFNKFRNRTNVANAQV